MRTTMLCVAIGASLALGGLAACGDTATSSFSDMAAATSPDMQVAPADMTPRGPDLGCYANPVTYQALLNACTTAQAIDKTPVTPLLNQDGTLPPLP